MRLCIAVINRCQTYQVWDPPPPPLPPHTARTIVSHVVICLLVAQVFLWEAACMAVMYVFYVCITFWAGRGDEPVHADVARHEIPLEEGVGENDLRAATFRVYHAQGWSCKSMQWAAGHDCANSYTQHAGQSYQPFARPSSTCPHLCQASSMCWGASLPCIILTCLPCPRCPRKEANWVNWLVCCRGCCCCRYS